MKDKEHYFTGQKISEAPLRKTGVEQNFKSHTHTHTHTHTPTHTHIHTLGLPGCLSGNESTCQCNAGNIGDVGLIPE